MKVENGKSKIAVLSIYNKTPCHEGRVFYNYALRDRLNSLAVVAIVSIEVHLLDFLEERISWVCTCALVIKCLLCHSVKTVEEVLFVRNIILDRVLDANSCLEVVNSLDKVFNALCIVLAAEAE